MDALYDYVLTKQLPTNDFQNLTSNTLIYRTFATKPIDSFLGISVQKERLYVVQKKTICLFEYFSGYHNTCTQKVPVLIKEILLPFEISKYIITEKYICIKSKNKTEIRDNEFQKVFYSENSGIMITRPPHQNQQSHNSNNFTFDIVEEFELECEIANDEMVSWKVVTKKKSQTTNPRYLREYWSERYNILTRHKSIIKCRAEMIDPSNRNRKIQICKSPVFVSQLGYIQNFYIWPVSANDIQVGIFYNYKEQQNITENHLYEICSFQLKETNIKNIFHYNFTNANSAKNKDGPHLFLGVCQNTTLKNSEEKSLIKIVIFEILPQQNLAPNQSLNEALNNCLDQFNQLRKQKKSQQSLSNSNLLNELLNGEGKNATGTNPTQPSVIIESFILKNSGSLKKIFYNPLTNVLWINDTSELVYRIKFIETGDLMHIKEKNLSFIESLEGFKNGETKPDLEGVMYDNYPVFKVNSFNLEIGTRMTKEVPEIQAENDTELKAEDHGHQKDDDEKEVIEFDDKELEKIDQQKSKEKLSIGKVSEAKNKELKISSQVKISSNHQNPQKNDDKQKPEFQTKQTQTQTETDFSAQRTSENEGEKHIQINNLSELLKELNFNKVEEVLMRFSQIFSGLVTKNINKLKDFNQKAKEEIKLKINGDIFELIKEVFTTLLSDALSQKIQKQVLKAREFVEKILSKHVEHFNLMLIDQRTKEENIKKCILQQQLRSIDIIKEASFKFLDVTKIRQMQKIAYNEVVVNSIKQVGKKLQDVQQRLDQFSRESSEMERKIMEEVKEIKETFKLLIQLEEDDSLKDESQDADEAECSESGFGSEQDEEEEDEVNEKGIMIGRKGTEDNRILQRHGVEHAQHYPLMVSHQMAPFNERVPGWNSFYPPVGHSYQPYPPPPPQYPSQYPPQQFYPPSTQQQFYAPPELYYAPMSQQFSGKNSPFTGTMKSHQVSYMPSPPSVMTPQYSQIRKGPQVEVDKKEKKRRVKSSGMGSLLVKNE